MFHPLIRLIAAKPHLVARHLGGYADLVSVQAADATLALRTRALLAATAGACLVVGVAMAGVAVLLAAVQPVASMPAPWLLLAAPLLPMLAAAAVALQLRRHPAAWSLAALRAQLAADLALLTEAGQA